MKYLVAPGQDVKIAGTLYNEGEVVEIRGRATAREFDGKLVVIEDAELLRNLEVNAHPMYVLRPNKWARIDYLEGDVIWVPTRAAGKLIADWTRPATGVEVMAAVKRQKDAREARKMGRPVRQALTDDTVKDPSTQTRRGPGRPKGSTTRGRKNPMPTLTPPRSARQAAV